MQRNITLKNDINQFDIQSKLLKRNHELKVSNKLKGYMKIEVRFKFFVFFFSILS